MNDYKKYFPLFLVIAFLLFIILVRVSCAGGGKGALQTVEVKRGDIKAQISTTGIVMPRNRLEIKPPVAGRIDEVKVEEGQRVIKGQVLAMMSSSDRAALLDAARSKGDAEYKKWEDVYKPAPVVAPLNGFIIQRSVEAGQSVTTNDPVLVMADKLIVKAQVDETDIGSIKVGQAVNIELDAYPGKVISGKVEHIAYESVTVNNVTIYEVNVVPLSVPSYFRSGMSSNVSFILSARKDALIVPLRAVKTIGNNSYVFRFDKGKAGPAQVKVGLENTSHIEVLDGLSEGDMIAIPNAKMIEELESKFSRQRRPMNPFQKRN
ncbi:efflux RND transporter periplasmic adaptor subunit [Candidatus Margulisiibacteriota bacterium]